MTWEVEGIRQRGRPKKTWWDCAEDDMESLFVYLVFNGTFSTNRLYRAIVIGSISRRAGGQHKNIMHLNNERIQ